MHILIKLPSRGRPEKLKDTFLKYLQFAEDISKISFLISLDDDDTTITRTLQIVLKGLHPDVTVVVGPSTGKIGAVNRDMKEVQNYDIILLASDDMIPIKKGYDQIIRNKMIEYYPDTDGVLHFNDGFVGKKLNTLCILGKKYYDRFGYIYHPSYKTEFCDNEFTEIANRLGRQHYFEETIIKHEHPIWISVEKDATYLKNDTFIEGDRANYHRRNKIGYAYMKVFSFCLFGSKPKYIMGMHENIKTISIKFPDWKVFIYHDNSISIDEFKKYSNVVTRLGLYNGLKLTLERYCAIDEPDVEIMMARDADSRINERDEWCINRFIQSDKLFHMIHDHPYHTVPIMGGLWGIKKGCLPDFIFRTAIDIYQVGKFNHDCDQQFLASCVYPKVRDISLYHGELPNRFKGEGSIPIPFKNDHMFCGQVFEYDDEGHEYHRCTDCLDIKTN